MNIIIPLKEDFDEEETRIIDLGDYFTLEQLLRSFIDEWLLIKGTSKDEVPFNAINDVLEKNGYEPLNVFQLSEIQKETVRDAYLEASRRSNVQIKLSEAFEQKKQINYTNYGDIVWIIKKSIENMSIKVDSQNDTIIPFTDIFDTLENDWYEKTNRFQTPEDVKDLIIEAWKVAYKNN